MTVPSALEIPTEAAKLQPLRQVAAGIGMAGAC
jgi:hypothetical protein